MPPPVKTPIGFTASLSTNLNVGNSAKDLSLEQAICGANGEGEDKDLDYAPLLQGDRNEAHSVVPDMRKCGVAA